MTIPHSSSAQRRRRPGIDEPSVAFLDSLYLLFAHAMAEAAPNARALGRRRRGSSPETLDLLQRETVVRLLQLFVLAAAADRCWMTYDELRDPDALASLASRLALPMPGDSAPLLLHLPPDAWRHALDLLSVIERPGARGLGDLYQALLDCRLVAATGHSLQVVHQRDSRKSRGAFFTPDSLVTRLVRKTLSPLLASRGSRPVDVLTLRIVDPAMGAGQFLLTVIDTLAEHLVVREDDLPLEAPGHAEAIAMRRIDVANACVYGVDEDPMVVDLARAVLWLDTATDTRWPTSLGRHLKAGNALVGAPVAALLESIGPSARLADHVAKLRAAADAWMRPWTSGPNQIWAPFHWQLEFPEVAFDAEGNLRGGFGFDAMVANPPWNRLRPEKRSFYAQYAGAGDTAADLSSVQGGSLDSMIERLELEQPGLRDKWNRYEQSLSELTSFLRKSGLYPAQHADIDGRRAAGDPDLFRYFVERAFQCVRPGGRVGLVVPATLWQAEGCTGLRRMLLSEATLDEVCVFENRRKWAFDIDSRFKFSAFTTTASPPPAAHAFRAAFMLPGPGDWDDTASTRFVRMTASDLVQLSPGTAALPDFRCADDAAMVARLHERNPCLGAPDSGWQFTFCRELDITTDARWFRTAEWMRRRGFSLLRPVLDEQGRRTQQRFGPADAIVPPELAATHPGGDTWLSADEAWYRRNGYAERVRRTSAGESVVEFLHPDELRAGNSPRSDEAFLIRPSSACTPLFEGRMVHHFDHAQKRWVSGQGPRAVWQTIPFADKALEPRVFVCSEQVGAPSLRRVAFGAVASATNERSCLAALLPDTCLAGNSTPTLALPTREDAALLVCVLCSFVFDYLVRLRTTTNINWTQLSRIAVPRPGEFPAKERHELIDAAMRLSCTTPELAPAWNELYPEQPWTYASAERDPWRRAALRAYVDSLIATRYGLAPEEYARMLAAFPLLDRGQPALPGDLFVGDADSPGEPSAANGMPRSFITRDYALFVHLQRLDTPADFDLHAYYRDCVGIDPDGPASRFRLGELRSLSQRVQAARDLGAIPYVAPGR